MVSLRRIALVDGPDELLALLAKPLALWRVFLHPSQEEVAYCPTYWGSAQVTGGPGTGNTVVALPRVKHLATSRELPSRSILLTTYTRSLADALERDLTQLLDPEQRSAVEVLKVDRGARGVGRAAHGHGAVAKDEELLGRLEGGPFPPTFLMEEWRQVVLANDVHSEEAYLAAPRRGRGRGLTKGQKRQVWATLASFVDGLRRDRLWTWLTVADVPVGPDDLFLTGDPHQRIYGDHVSLRAVGISVAGRSSRLRINYRTSAEILQWAMGVLGDTAIADLDDGLDSLSGYRSALHGEHPDLAPAATPAQERCLLFVACTRVRGRLRVLWSGARSELVPV